MTEKKKEQSADFAKDKNAFAGGTPTKGDNAQNAKQKQSGAHQPRDADKTSGHDVQKSEGNPEGGSFRENRNSFQGGTEKTAGQRAKPDEKSADSQGGSKRRTVFLRKMRSRRAAMRKAGRRAALQRKKTPLRRTAEGSRPEKRKIFRTITAAGTPTTRAKKRADTVGGSIRTGSARKNLILNVTSRRKMPPLQKRIPLPVAQSRSFRAAKN